MPSANIDLLPAPQLDLTVEHEEGELHLIGCGEVTHVDSWYLPTPQNWPQREILLRYLHAATPTPKCSPFVSKRLKGASQSYFSTKR
jgi:hypothetical protein